jgi:3-phosphoshikimate 1-carboxyvinyltransferase
MFRFIGADIRVDGLRVDLRDSGDLLRSIGPLELEVPGDPSSAAFLCAAVLLASSGEVKLECVSVNPTRTGFLDVMNRMGARIRVENERDCCGEPVADVVVGAAHLRATEVEQLEVPRTIDELPILAVLAARAEGETVFRSVGELRVKESDRLTSIAENLRRLGVEAEISGDDLFVCGTDRRLQGRVDTRGDHRISMAFAVLGTAPGVDLELSETASTGISYPRFFEDLQSVRGNG